MRIPGLSCFVLGGLLMISCDSNPPSKTTKSSDLILGKSQTDTLNSLAPLSGDAEIETGDVKPEELIAFARTLIGTGYKYGSSNPDQGFDCSGFITYVFNKFSISVPRSSKDFRDSGREISLDKAKEGDLVLFTGTDPGNPEIGHMGIITENRDTARFIHSTSGKAFGVTLTPLNDYYMKRFVKVIRVFD